MSGHSPYVRSYERNQTPINLTCAAFILVIGWFVAARLYQRGGLRGIAIGLALSVTLFALTFAAWR